MNSPTHRENILNEKFTEIGIGYATGDYQGINNNTVIVAHFGSQYNYQPSLSTPTPNPTATEVANSEINIINPIDGSFFNSNDFTISGDAGGLANIDIKSNNSELGQADINNGTFSYRPNTNQFTDEGVYSIQATGLNGPLLENSPLSM